MLFLIVYQLNQKYYFPKFLTWLVILPVHAFEGSFPQNLPMMIFILDALPIRNNSKRLKTKQIG
jgi:hypothetical protein